MARTLAGYATQVDPIDDIVCAYTTSPTQIPSTPDDPPVVIGEFSVPTAVRCRLDVLGFVSTAGRTLNVAIYAPSLLAGSSVFISDLAPVKRRSQPLDLVPDVVYQICAQCVGAETETGFGVIRHASLGAP